MAIQKIDVLALGRGSITNNTEAVIQFASNNVISTWSNTQTYNQYNTVEYSGKVYRSKIAGNIGNQPNISPNEWEVLYSGVKDGDICWVVNGINSTVLQRINGIWNYIQDNIVTLNLNDGQATPADAVVFLGSTRPFAKIEYTVRRGTGHDRKRRGVINLLNDGISSINYDHEFNEIGSDVNVPFIITMSGGNVKLQYTSASESIPIQMKYTIKGWA